MNKMYLVMLKLLIEKSNITLGEARNLKYSLNYVVSNYESEKNSQFYKDCNILFETLQKLEKKILTNIEDMENKEKEFKTILESDEMVVSNVHLTNILLLDCFQAREFSFSDKLEYLHHSYENLISPYQTLYLPLPNSYRRVRTSNLMLYFNKTLNNKVNTLKNNFFHNVPEANNSTYNVFSTWNFSDYDHVKNLDDSNNILLSLSFWFYEKQLFYPIAYHEIAHSLYYDSDEVIKLNNEDAIEFKTYLDNYLVGSQDIFSRNQVFIQNIYQDIIADFTAYSLSGDSYIFTLFFHGFIQGLYRNFYQDLDIKNTGQKINDNERRCIEREKDMTLLDWSFYDKGQNFISFFIRLKLLIKLSKILNKLDVNTYNFFKKEIDEVDEILGYIYSSNNIRTKNTFEEILQSFYKENRQYKYWKNYTLLLVNLYEKIVFENKKIQERVYKTLLHTNNEFRNNTNFKNILIKNGECTKELDQMNSPYDLYWHRTFNNKEYSGRILRLHNLTELGIKPKKENINEIIYELVFYKFASKDDPFLLFCKNNSHGILQSKDLKYAFGPYDFVEINMRRTLEKDKELEEDFQKNHSFFTERHALLLLNEIYNNEFNTSKVDTSKNIFDICISIDISNELDSTQYSDFYTKMNSFISKQDNYEYRAIKFFSSLGNENFLIYIENTKITFFEKFVHDIVNTFDSIKNIHSTILLNSNDFIHYDKFDINTSENEIVLLGKLKKKKDFQEVEKIKNEYIQVYKKYGIFDFIIKFRPNGNILKTIHDTIETINSLVSDVQFEYQSI